LYGGDKPTLKGFKHKKDFSNIKWFYSLLDVFPDISLIYIWSSIWIK
jgi:hypothetical protein